MRGQNTGHTFCTLRLREITSDALKIKVNTVVDYYCIYLSHHIFEVCETSKKLILYYKNLLFLNLQGRTFSLIIYIAEHDLTCLCFCVKK